MALNNQAGIFGGTRSAPVESIKRPRNSHYTNASACEMTVQIGIFFDGTGNNLVRDEGKLAHSNVARLFKTYPHRSEQGSYAIYIPGLGTPFPEIGELTETRLGSAFARGGDSRIVFAILRTFNVLNRSLFKRELFPAETLRALCQCTALSPADIKLLQGWGLERNLVDDGSGATRVRFLDICANGIQSRMVDKHVPKIHECVIDIFGFSRGATEARVFCHWLADLMKDRKLAGISCRFRFLGIMDTVASVGIAEGIGKALSRQTGGHGDWATPEAMRILPEVENCVHLVAMHEWRKNFPVDSVTVDGRLPSNCMEYAYPGSHSDVGGGYSSGELGVASGPPLVGDALKLSQVPLNHMYECAVMAGVPLSLSRLTREADQASFFLHDDLRKAYEKFFEILTLAPRPLSSWALPYLAWRWQVKLEYKKTGQYSKANAEDSQDLWDSNAQFYSLAEKMRLAEERQSRKLYSAADSLTPELSLLEMEAQELRARVASQPKIDPVLAAFFDDFVHDSLAGFRKQVAEPTSYWRYRRVFCGSAVVYTG